MGFTLFACLVDDAFWCCLSGCGGVVGELDSGCEHLFCFVLLGFSFCGHSVDALVPGADEGRGGLRYSLGSWRASVDPGVSEWGNLARLDFWLPSLECIGWWGERGEVKHLSTCRKRYSVSSGERKRMMAKLRACYWVQP